jgi:hypothetical protein
MSFDLLPSAPVQVSGLSTVEQLIGQHHRRSIRSLAAMSAGGAISLAVPRTSVTPRCA